MNGIPETTDILCFSQYFCTYQREDIVALYHTLNIRVAFLSLADFEKLEVFKYGYSRTKFLSDSEDCQYYDQIIEKLIELEMLVTVNEDQNQKLEELRRKYLGRPDIQIMYLLITDVCNFACKYCFIEEGIPAVYTHTYMSNRTAKNALDLFVEHAHICDNPDHSPKIEIYGGEPLLNLEVLPFILEYIDSLKRQRKLPPGTEIGMVTNGSKITKDVAELLKKHNVNVAVSIDGPPELNISRRYTDHRPVYDDTVQGLKTLQEVGLNPGISCTINECNIDRMDELITWVRDLGTPSLNFNLLAELPNAPKVSDTYTLKSTREILRIYKTLRELNIYEDRVGRRVESFANSQITPFDCGAYGGQFVIAPNGDLGVCHAYTGSRKYFVINVNEDTSDFCPVHDPVFQEWSYRSPFRMSQCRNCPAIGVCGGGCAYNAELRNGSIWTLDDRFCAHALSTLEWMIWDIYEITQK